MAKKGSFRYNRQQIMKEAKARRQKGLEAELSKLKMENEHLKLQNKLDKAKTQLSQMKKGGKK